MVTRAQRRKLARVAYAHALGKLGAWERSFLAGFVDGMVEAVHGRDLIDDINEVYETILDNMQEAKDKGLMGKMPHESSVNPGPRLRERLDWLAAGMATGTVRTCKHIDNTPRGLIYEFSQDLIHCGCTSVHYDEIEEFTCDICREYHKDDCSPHIMVLGPIAVGFGICESCAETELLPA